MTIELHAGILIIGSLYWDDDGGRDRWRRWRLDFTQTWHVRAPIRYARKSASRGGTYTMVFSDLEGENLGQATVVACREPIRSPNDLITEARWLWAAETKDVPQRDDGSLSSRLSARWGRVALMRRPDASIPTTLLERWAEEFSGRDDALMVDEQGLLEVNWPITSATNAVLPIDLLLAMTNRPTDANPSAREIAEAWNVHGFRDYFDNNQSAGILTFQDAEIKQYLK